MEEYNTEYQQCNQMDCQETKLVVLSLKHVGDVMILELHYQFGTLSLLITRQFKGKRKSANLEH